MFTKSIVANLCFAAMLCTGCASIVHGGDRDISVYSTPSGASFTITDAKETIVASGTTPTTVRLKPGKAYFHGMKYKLAIQNPSAFTTTAPADVRTSGDSTINALSTATIIDITPKLSPWYFGNIVFGGLIGLVIVDPITGAMWDLGPATINHSFVTRQTTFEAPQAEPMKASDQPAVEASMPVTAIE